MFRQAPHLNMFRLQRASFRSCHCPSCWLPPYSSLCLSLSVPSPPVPSWLFPAPFYHLWFVNGSHRIRLRLTPKLSRRLRWLSASRTLFVNYFAYVWLII